MKCRHLHYILMTNIQYQYDHLVNMYLCYVGKDIKHSHLANQIEDERVAAEYDRCFGVILKEDNQSFTKANVDIKNEIMIMKVGLCVFTFSLENVNQSMTS